ncbi:hypothetical protein [Actinoplanes sp. NPDC049802]|uniref:hypothetical protein n=1 Tax=Actinoplanes sp. NPDC049802 TaxID=3154742 RepID=UPI0033F4163E
MTEIPETPARPEIERPIDLTDTPDRGSAGRAPLPAPEPEPVTRPGPEEPLEHR